VVGRVKQALLVPTPRVEGKRYRTVDSKRDVSTSWLQFGTGVIKTNRTDPIVRANQAPCGTLRREAPQTMERSQQVSDKAHSTVGGGNENVQQPSMKPKKRKKAIAIGQDRFLTNGIESVRREVVTNITVATANP
jgi:hypothetical protein